MNRAVPPGDRGHRGADPSRACGSGGVVPGAGGLVGGITAAGREGTIEVAPLHAHARWLPGGGRVAQPGLGRRNVGLPGRNGGLLGASPAHAPGQQGWQRPDDRR